MGYEVKVDGLAEFRRDLRRLDRESLGQIRDSLKEAADIVARRAALLAPRRTGALAASYKPFTAGNRAGVRSNLPYAGVVEYGGTIRPRGYDIRFRRALPLTRARDMEAGAVVDDLADRIDVVARRSGWK
jgi:hypothetical protein